MLAGTSLLSFSSLPAIQLATCKSHHHSHNHQHFHHQNNRWPWPAWTMFKAETNLHSRACWLTFIKALLVNTRYFLSQQRHSCSTKVLLKFLKALLVNTRYCQSSQKHSCSTQGSIEVRWTSIWSALGQHKVIPFWISSWCCLEAVCWSLTRNGRRTSFNSSSIQHSWKKVGT